MRPYLPEIATLEQAQAWLEHETGQQWPLARLIEEADVIPGVWIDFTSGFEMLFAGAKSGYLAPLESAADRARIAAGADDVLITQTRTADDKFALVEGLERPLSDLRFRAEDIRRAAEFGAEQPAANHPKPKKTRRDGLSVAMEQGFDKYTKRHGREPTARSLFDYLAENASDAGPIVEWDKTNDKLTWRRQDGGLSETTFKAFQTRFTGTKSRT